MAKILEAVLLGMVVIGFGGCESSRSVTATAPESQKFENSADSDSTEESLVQTVSPSALVVEAADKYRLATQLLEFSGPIEDLSNESRDVRRLAADLLISAIELDPTEFKYYRDLFMTHMVLQEPVKAFEAIEPARTFPDMAEELAEFHSLVFGAMVYVSAIELEN